MRKRVSVFSLAVLILAGCTAETDHLADKPADITDPVKKNDQDRKNVTQQLLKADPATFHFVADWLTDSTIAYVEKSDGRYKVNSFDLETGKTMMLYEDSSMIIDVLIHPLREYMLIHTSDDPTAATVKLMTIDGVVQDELTVASTELAIEWNDLDPQLILLTGFQPDWTFDVFLYDGHKEQFGLLTMEEPFPKWFGTEKVVLGRVAEHALDGAELLTYELATEQWSLLDVGNAIYFDTYEDVILIASLGDENTAKYTIRGQDGEIRSEWQMPAISNYSEWIHPDIEWISKDVIVLAAPDEGGQLDELASPYRLIRVTEGRQEVVTEEVIQSSLRCSPAGKYCLTGYSLETLIDVETKKEIPWLTFPES
ncbi:hypothetical protein MKY34_13350 [Sporosarcina sp. FSL K6-1522]|uniref:YqgU-like beta propeller domain-containing protein n=1 Tax=Sporosarcina sp. FSL K6-1522 TaxID=2921554 RepID=UPI003159E3B1